MSLDIPELYTEFPIVDGLMGINNKWRFITAQSMNNDEPFNILTR